jgi:hypothetical protein
MAQWLRAQEVERGIIEIEAEGEHDHVYLSFLNRAKKFGFAKTVNM